MTRVHVFVDESGNFDCSIGPKDRRYFLITTMTTNDFSLGDDLLQLRRQLVWDGIPLESGFHAKQDQLVVRDLVFNVLEAHDFRVDVTILDKWKAVPRLCNDSDRFYKTAVFYHMKYVTPRIVGSADELFFIAATLHQARKRRRQTHAHLLDVIEQVCHCPAVTAAVESSSEPCLQAVDYCCWAVQRKWQKDDTSYYDRIKDKIKSECNLFGGGRIRGA